MTTTNDLHRELQQWRNRAISAEARLATCEATTARTIRKEDR